jgi:WD40 repeat protein
MNLPNKLSRVLKGHTDSVNSVHLSTDGQLALIGSDDHTARLWDLHKW